MKLVRKVTTIFDGTVNLLAVLAAVLMVFILFLIVAEVVSRGFWNRPIPGVIEATAFSLLSITFLGTAWVLREEKHVKIDLVLTRLKPANQALLNIITSLIGAIVCLIIVWYGVRVVWEVLREGYRSATMIEISLAPILVIIPVGTFLLSIQFLRRAYGYLRSRRALRSQ